MSRRLVVFISSTVEDLDDVRRELKAELERREIEVRLSEEPDFPVEPGVTSHDACLHAVRTAHVFVLLVGERFGGEYQGQNKSITWREWEEAMQAGLLPVVLVRSGANALAREIFRERRALVSAHPGASVAEIDAMLRMDPRFADRKPDRHNLPGVQRFIDELRKGHIDNWMHPDWDGTASAALRRIDARLSAALASHRSQQASAREIAQAERHRADAVYLLLSATAQLVLDVRAGRASLDDALDRLLALITQDRGRLMGFGDRDLHNFVLYVREGDLLVQRARACHRAIPRRGRNWKVGQGHVGLAVERKMLMVGGDIRHTAAWVPAREQPSDREMYVSAVSAPFSFRAGAEDRDAVLIVTSSRLDHFRTPDQVDVLTVGALAHIFSVLLSATWSPR
jgi:hypothetical protein